MRAGQRQGSRIGKDRLFSRNGAANKRAELRGVQKTQHSYPWRLPKITGRILGRKTKQKDSKPPSGAMRRAEKGAFCSHAILCLLRGCLAQDKRAAHTACFCPQTDGRSRWLPGLRHKKTGPFEKARQMGFYMDWWKVRLMTSSCCSRVRRLKLTA